MGTKQRREREKEELRSRILDAARELFAREGYEAVSMRRIAEAIEYSPTAIYGYFTDKATLLRALCEEDFGKMNADNRAALEIPDPVERIRQLGLHYIRFAVTHPNHFRLMFMTKPAPEMTQTTEAERIEQGKGDPNRDGYALVLLSVKEAMEQGRVRADLRDPDLVTQLLWAGVHGVAALESTQPDSDNWCPWSGADVLGRAMVNLIFRGILREGDPAVALQGKKE
jgi:AcrR family transcriptional regulator